MNSAWKKAQSMEKCQTEVLITLLRAYEIRFNILVSVVLTLVLQEVVACCINATGGRHWGSCNPL